MNDLNNKVQLIGNLGMDPEMFTFENGNKKAKFSVATTQTYYDNKGEKVDDTQWHNIVAWGKLAEITEKILKKGKKVAIEGKLVYRNYDDKDGQKKYITEIVMNDLMLLTKKED